MHKQISGYSSIFLDGLRLSASLIVLLVHAQAKWLMPEDYLLKEVKDWGHAAVVVFFVLSGYVISFTSYTKNRGLVDYCSARISRLYSVLIPTLIISGIFEIIIYSFDYNVYSLFNRDYSLIRYFMTSFYLNEIWFLSAAPPINVPLWSLSYEFWYYALFGAWFFLKNRIVKIICLICIGLIAGPKILLMFPIWLLGVVVYKLKRPKLKNLYSWIIIAILLITSIVIVLIIPSYPFKLGTTPLFWSGQFVTDFILGLFIAAILYFLPVSITDITFEKRKSVKLFRKVADLTFPLYVLHMPFLFLLMLVFDSKEKDLQIFYSVLVIVVVACTCIGWGLNAQRSLWRKSSNKIMSYLSFKLKAIL